MFLGIDLGTTDIKALLLSEEQSIIAIERCPLSIQRPQPLWSEQSPLAWRDGVFLVLDQLAASFPHAMSQVTAIGLSGQMHGAVLLDHKQQLIRPAILWNDGRSHQECLSLKMLVPDIETISGNLVMPGFTAPKLLWVKNHEPKCFERISKVLLPKDYIRYFLSGSLATDYSDASGTLWLNVQQRCWSTEVLEACGLTSDHMPELIESNAVSGYLHPSLALRWGMREQVVIAGGAADNAASAIGIGAVQPGQGFISLGTSGVVFACSDRYQPNPLRAIHAFCHAVPHHWYQMAVMLSAASCLSWVSRLTNQPNEAAALSLAEQLSPSRYLSAPIFLPYLSGERTPHNNPYAQGLFFGLTHQHEAADLIYAVVEGVSFGLLDGLNGMSKPEHTASPFSFSLVGGGTRNLFWSQLLTDTLQIPLDIREGCEAGGALGAARLAQSATGACIQQLCPQPPVLAQLQPAQAFNHERYERFKALYPLNLPFFTSH